tara:strand:- start:3 stop:269 length:267 start_codon:yes stop_codon:yes gene_type:complete
MQLGIPITINTGGTRAIKIEISYPNKAILPKERITPITTTIIDEIAALNDLKKKYKINAVIIKVNKINIEISFFTFIESTVLIYGKPE